MNLPETFTLKVERGSKSLWYVTSPDIKGLLVAEHTMPEATRAVPKVLAGMMLADAGNKK